ncbi:30S ribosomal protein S12 methylthiotransferase RimO [Microbacter margulisiae]|uniref:Ribosomal protein uS12 methylthiotransferase RimO n=1 Tax=Microbacter margulisiae TaxID=1350067 RepID=A0A7W5H1T8_9PORP|nr:30S ribosomal protein S12 methylthiotransferase RimO [Microbacter margulisiae]MBB3187953.1 ribosomal protein S12 methylthiotransferase [Microbacter margulisiae]
MTIDKSNLVDFITLGCSKNLVDSEHLMRQLAVSGYQVHHDPEKPEGRIVIINTCGFIGDAQEESINTILQFAELRKQKKIDKLFVMGCLSQRYLKELEEEIPEVDHYYGKFNFNEILGDLSKTYNPNFALERSFTTPSHYAYVKISEGCDRTCSYCAIPIITGKHKSRSQEDIIQEVQWLVSQGVKEVQLIAQDLSYYGYDINGKPLLPDLVNRIADIQDLKWIRLHYAYPANFPYKLLDVMRERDNVCKYLDLALQHSSDDMLKRMRRNITLDQTRTLLQAIREGVPGIHLRTTMLVGHPGETDLDFQALKAFVAEQRFERLGVFAYSHENGTYAYNHYVDDVPKTVKSDRVSEIMELQRTISSELNQQKVGKTFKVIIDKTEGDFYVGRTEFDSPEVDPEVLIAKTNKLSIGSFYSAKIINFDDYDLFGEVVF